MRLGNDRNERTAGCVARPRHRSARGASAVKILQGIAVSPGVAIGRVFVVDDDVGLEVTRRAIAAADVEPELAAFDAARTAAVADLQEIHARAKDEMGEEAARIFLFHMAALSDKQLIEPVRAMIESERVSAAYAAASVIRGWGERLRRQGSEAIRSKVTDLEDLLGRLLDHLIGARRDALSHLDADTVVIAKDLTPSQTAGFDRNQVRGFVTDLGGPTSHTAIVAKALELPAVVGCQHMTETATDGATIIVDGDRGTVILDPDEVTVSRYRARAEAQQSVRISLQEFAGLDPVTKDGVRVELQGNIEFPAEAEAVRKFGGTGVGLYRTEFLYLTSDTEPTEEDHYEAYRKCIEVLDGLPLTIRTVDLGADKYTQARARTPERNPFLGLRSIRYCLQNLAMFKTQLRAILRASALGPVKLMFPLIGSLAELRKAKHLLADAMEDLQEIGQPFDRAMPVGMMVEVPSAALLAQSFARESDFFSIGTNDLVQYTLAVDRTNERVADLYRPEHPAVVRLIRDVVRAARRGETPVSCCGEAASEPAFAALLLGLGVRTLSVPAPTIPALKRLIRGLDLARCERIARKAVSLDSEAEAAAYVRDRVRKMVPEAFEGPESAD